MSNAFVVAILCMLSSAATVAKADAFDGLDVATGSGAVMGTVIATDSDGTTRRFTTNGIPFVAMLYRDLASHWTGNLQAQVLLDLRNQQMIRQGFAGTMAYHVLGGARRIVSANDVVRNISTSRYNLSLLLRGGVFNYAATDRENPKLRLSGSVWEMASGLEYRWTMSDTSAVGASVLGSVITLPASVDRLTARTVEVLGFWRVYL